MPTIIAHSDVKELSLEAVVIRCGCDGKHEAIHPRNEDGSLGPCPNPRRTEDLGRIAYYNRNPFKQFWWDFKQALKGRKP